MHPTSHVFLLRELVRRDFTGRYAGSFLGLAWSFVHPIWQMLLFSFVFSIVLRLPLTSEATDRFWVFLFCGLLPWMALNEGVQGGATAITSRAELVKKLSFPAEILVVSTVTTALLHQAIAMGVFLVALVWVGELAWGNLILLPVALFFQVFMTLGLGFFLASLQVFFRDTVQGLGLVMSAWFYLTPIVFPAALVPAPYDRVMAWNPLAILVELYRRALIGGGTGPWWTGLEKLAIFTVIVFAGGLWTFRSLKTTFVDEI